MANPSWLNDNQFRDYPFITRVEPLADTPGFTAASSLMVALDLPSSAILDFGAIMEIDAGFDEAQGHYIYLHSVSRTGSVFTFRFRTNATESSNHELVFHRNLTDPEFLLEWEDASTINAESEEPLTCPTLPKWKGFLATGNLSDLGQIVASGETHVAVQGLWKIEPARVQSLLKSYLRAINLANRPRVHATLPDACSASSSEENTAAIVHDLCLAGNIQWKEGYNCGIRQDVNNNAIIISAGVGIGAGEPCDEVPLYPEEAPPAGSPFLSGGPACNEIIKSINGVSGTDVTILAGPGFRIFADDVATNKLIIDRALDDFTQLCSIDVVSSVSEADPTDPCHELSAADVFYIAIRSGELAGNTAVCIYDPIMSAEGQLSWSSEFVTENDWVGDNYCGFRWRAKVVCAEDGVHISVMGYPLADNNPCIVCATVLAHPVMLPLNQTLLMTRTRRTELCNCVSIDLATQVTVTQ